jgi:hypothetical protein
VADTKISALTELTALDNLDQFVVVDVSDTTMAASGTTKRIGAANAGVTRGQAVALTAGNFQP